ncbi:hypothetical protein [Mesorhizobium sp. M1396]|uniref:hypothetical protein n=1 Tax=Mesorhizobium sp. M1396 TaxID=2957095 RepID=UPI00333B49F5
MEQRDDGDGVQMHLHSNELPRKSVSVLSRILEEYVIITNRSEVTDLPKLRHACSGLLGETVQQRDQATAFNHCLAECDAYMQRTMK